MGEALFFEGARLFVISLGMEKPVGDVWPFYVRAQVTRILARRAQP